MKEMKYSKERKIEVLATGYCFGLLYYILNLGTHPTAYIKLPNNSSIDENEIDVHGGITYSEDHLWIMHIIWIMVDMKNYYQKK
mgnify:CR=1 FL=1